MELFFGVLQRRFLVRGSFSSLKDFERRLERYLKDYNAHHAHPYRWTYTGEPLVRDTPFSRIGVSNATVGLVLACGQSDLSGYLIRHDRTGDRSYDLVQTKVTVQVCLYGNALGYGWV